MLPTIETSGYSLPQTWERSLGYLWELGEPAPDAHARPDDPLNVDSRMVMTIQCPQAEPSIHKGFPGGVGDLEIYALEVVEGLDDHLVCQGKLPYTYHDRLTRYPVLVGGTCRPRVTYINQIQEMINALVLDPGSRRAQCITWVPWLDIGHPNPPCLQRVWARILGDHLCVGLHWRSRDAYDAAFMNLWAFAQWAKIWAQELTKRLGRQIVLGPMMDVSDSYHIRGKRLDDFRIRFLPSLEGRMFRDRVWSMEQTREVRTEARKERGLNGCF